MTQHNDTDDNDSIHDLFRGIALESNPASNVQRQTPFKFLDPYQLEDRDLFFGRDLEIRELYSKYYTERLLLVYGESGSGKTSLIQCGLQAEIPQEDALFVFIRMATGTPQAVLTTALNQQLKKPINTSPLETSLDALLDEVYRQKNKSVVLVLDQFEEFFFFHSAAVRKIFTQQLAQWLAEKSYLHVIISIREEYYARLTELEQELPELFDNRLWVRKMSREQAQEVITQPCKRCDINIEKSVSDTLLDDLTQDNKEIDLPILQVILDRLYTKANQQQADKPVLTLESYQALGKINKIVADFIEERIREHQQPELSRQVLKAMISAQGTRKVSTLESIQQRAKSFGATIPLKELQQQLQHLSDDRILRENAENGQYELRHDSLANPIHDWMTGLEKEMVEIRQDIDNRYQEYLKRHTLLDADFLRLVAPFAEHLHLDAEQKTFLQQSQQANTHKARRQLQGLIAGLCSLLIVVSAFWYQAEQAKQQAEQDRERAIGLIDYMNFELYDQLEPMGKLGVMDNVQRRIKQFFKSLELNANDNARYQKAVNLLQHANTQFAQGQLKQAEPLYQQAHQSFKQLTENDPSNTRWQHVLSVSFNKMGDFYRTKGEINKAFEQYQGALQINKTLVASDPNHKQWHYDLSISLNKMGQFYQAKGATDKALKRYQSALEIRSNLLKTDPHTIKRQRDLSVSLDNIGNLYYSQGKSDKALTAYQDSLRISQTVLERDPSNSRWQRDLSVGLNKVGKIYQAKGEIDKALKRYQEALLIRETLAKQDPSNIKWQRDLAMSYTLVGNCYQLKNADDKALNAYQTAHTIAQRLAENHPSNVLLQRGLSISFSKLGDISVKNNKTEAAKKGYSKALKIAETLAANYPYTFRYALDKAEFYYKLSRLMPQQRQQYVQLADDIIQKLAQAGKLEKADQDSFRQMKKGLGIE
jgi:tetratricopeptide (TPR) repeat protein/energy-coupling factor transporter ATP-binding protein EcfA2